MKKGIAIIVIVMLLLLVLITVIPPTSACGHRKKPKQEAETSILLKEYGDIELTGGTQTGHFNETWNLTKGDLKIEFTYDGTDLVDDGFDPQTMEGTYAISELGIRDTTANDLQPFGKGIWFNPLYDFSKDTLDPKEIVDTNWDNVPDTKAEETFDPDDRLLLQKGGPYWDEQDYDLPTGKGNPSASYGVWFDRDGINTSQEQWWGFKDGINYNTEGIYKIELLLHSVDSNNGQAYMKINGVNQGFWNNTMNNLKPDMYPAGMTFKGDMRNMQVFYGLFGFGTTQKVRFNDIKVTHLIEYDLNLDVKVNITGKKIQKSVVKELPDDVNIKFKFKLVTKARCNGDIYTKLRISIDNNDNVPVNVNINFQLIAAESKDDVVTRIWIYIIDVANVNINGSVKINNVNDDVSVWSYMRVRNSGDVKIDFTPIVNNVSDDAKITVRIFTNKCKKVILNIKIFAYDISDDVRIWLILKCWKCVDADINANISTWSIGDRTRIWKYIRKW